MGLLFTWDRKKAEQNLRRHGVSFGEAATVFADIHAVTISDPDHSADEERELTVGWSHRGRLLVVSHTSRGHSIRIISARMATRVSDETTKKASDMRDEYDFSEGTRGKYAERYRDGTNVVALDPDVARDFPDSESVNEALRQVQQQRLARRKPATKR